MSDGEHGNVRWYLVFWLFVLSAVAHDRSDGTSRARLMLRDVLVSEARSPPRRIFRDRCFRNGIYANGPPLEVLVESVEKIGDMREFAGLRDANGTKIPVLKFETKAAV